MSEDNYIYSFNYDYHLSDLCKLESRQLFNQEEKDKILFSPIKIDATVSPFIKNRFEIILSADNYDNLLEVIRQENIQAEGFKAEYLVLHGDNTKYPDRLNKLRDIGYRIVGEPNFTSPTTIYSICTYNGIWYFGILTKHDTGWLQHKNKPCSFSNSIHMKVAKSLVSIVSKGDKTKTLLDACCGAGTILLEGCYSGFDIEGCEISYRFCTKANKNLAHYNYSSYVHYCDIKDLHKKYDAAIIDLPYNLYTYSNEDITTNIIESTAKLTDRMVIVSISDIKPIIKKSGLKIVDCCDVVKRGKSSFKRIVWVCER